MTTDNILFDVFERVAPYHHYLFGIFMFSVTLVNLAAPTMAKVAPGCLLPDMMTFGYTPYQILTWYEAIGKTGRSYYAYFVYPVDLLLIMPSYTLLLGSHLYTQLMSARTKPLCYIPMLAVTMDLMESTTIAYGASVFPSITGAFKMEDLLTIASVATQVKHWAFVLAIVVAVASYLMSRVPSNGDDTKATQASAKED